MVKLGDKKTTKKTAPTATQKKKKAVKASENK